jgi:predicted Rossmann fold flavoprotein
MSNHEENYPVVIVGAGAAGLAAAIFAAKTIQQAGQRIVVVLDGAKSIGAKILISGGGRCNVTHAAITAKDFFGNRHIIKNVLAAFPIESTVAWFDSMGVQLKQEETGKLFPVSDRARTVLDALVMSCHELGVEIRQNHRVTGIQCFTEPEREFVIHHVQGTLRTKKIVMATGGRSLPKTGSDGFGLNLVQLLGHHVTLTVPALVPFMLEPAMFHSGLSGLAQQVELSTMLDGKLIDHRVGSMLWTHFGVSGPVIMDSSRFWSLATGQGSSVDLFGNFLPGQTHEQTRSWLLKQVADFPRRLLVKVLAQAVPERFAEAVCRHVGVNPRQAMAQVTRNHRDRVCESLARFRFPIARDRGWNHAEVTAGGVPLEEVNFRTMESKLVPGLYLVGEMLDCDGRIGGFNFQWAWATGYLAGRAVAHALQDQVIPQ